MLKSKLIFDPIYEQKYMFVHTDSCKELRKTFGFDRDTIGGSKRLFGFTIKHWVKKDGKRWNCVFIILNTNNSYKKMDFGTIAHECLHAMHFCFDHRGIELDVKNPEFQTYYLGWLVNHVVDFMGYETKIK